MARDGTTGSAFGRSSDLEPAISPLPGVAAYDKIRPGEATGRSSTEGEAQSPRQRATASGTTVGRIKRAKKSKTAMPTNSDISSLALGRLSVYLRCLRRLEDLGVARISSQEMARRFELSASQIRKDLAYFGEFGIRGVGYDVGDLKERLEGLLDLQRPHATVLVGAGNLGRALARFTGFNESFPIVALFDTDPEKIGTKIRGLEILHSRYLETVVGEMEAEIGILAVPAEVAQENYNRMVAAGLKGVLNFAPVQIRSDPAVRVRTVDLAIFLEELAFFGK